MLIARAQLIRIYVGTTDIRRWQNYSVGNSIKKNYSDTKKYKFMPFEITSGAETSTINVSAVDMSMPATADNVFVLTHALEQGYLCEVETFEFDASVGDEVTEILPVAKLLVSSYTGQVESVGSDLRTLQVSLGSSQLAVSPTVPPRMFNNYLVGIPFKP